MDNEQAFLKNQPLVTFTIAKYFPQFLKDDDAYQEANLALWKAVLAFEGEKGYRFSTWAATCIKDALLSHIRSLYLRNSHFVSLDDNIPIKAKKVPKIDTVPSNNEMDDAEWLSDFQNFYETLSASQKEIVRLRAIGMMDGEISRKLGMSRQTVQKKRDDIRNEYINFMNGA